MTTTVRRIRPDDWRATREFRLQALTDAVAHIAFLETYEEAAARPDAFWQERAEGAASGGAVAQFLAFVDDALAGTAAVLVQGEGDVDYHGRVVPRRRAVVVGVYVDPRFRGAGVIDALLDEAAEHARSLGVDQLVLGVHADNARAQGAYRRAGFATTGEAFTSHIGDEVEMVRAL